MPAKTNKITYKHFVEAFRSDLGKSKLIYANGPSSYLKTKVEEWFEKKNTGHDRSIRYSADSIKKADLDEMIYQDSIFDPESSYIIRNVERQAEISQTLKSIKSGSELKNKILLVSKGKSFASNIQKELNRLEAKVIPCFEPNLYELPKFVVSLAAKHKLKTNIQGAQLIISAVGSDLIKLENEIKKLSLIFIESQEEVTSEALAPYLDCLKEEHAFKLDQSLIAGKHALAQALLHDLLRRGESHLAILGILAHHCRKALQVHHLSREGKQVREISQAVGIPFNVVKNYIPYTQKTSPLKFKNALHKCQEADIIFKTSRVNSEIILSEVLSNLSMR